VEPEATSAAWAPALLLLIRIGVALRLTPFLGGRPLPWLPWAGLSVCVTLVLLPAVVAPGAARVDGLGTFVVLALRETLTGAALGLTARIAFSVLESAGGLLGAALPAVFAGGGATDERRSPLASLYVLFGTAAFLLMDGHHALLAALAGTIECLPPAAIPAAADPLAAGIDGALALFAGAFAWAVMIAAPVFVAGLAAELLSGLATRIAPVLGQGVGSQGLRTVVVQLALIAFLGATVTAAVGFLREGIEGLSACGG
jgi:flagellar biosynthesis protein FliR